MEAGMGGVGDICILPADLADVGLTPGDVELQRVGEHCMDHATWSPNGKLLACNLLKRRNIIGYSFLGTALVSFAPRPIFCYMLEMKTCNWEAANTMCYAYKQPSLHLLVCCKLAVQRARDAGGYGANGTDRQGVERAKPLSLQPLRHAPGQLGRWRYQ